MSLGCARCGSCCERIVVSFDPRDKPRQVADLDGGPWDPRTPAGMALWQQRHPEYDACPEGVFVEWTALLADARFFAAHWHVLWSDDRPPDDDHRWGGVKHVIECDVYDPDSRSCTAHDERPLACRYYPWYDEGPFASRAPVRRKATSLQHRGEVSPGIGCSYLLDAAPEDRAGLRPLIPIEPVAQT